MVGIVPAQDLQHGGQGNGPHNGGVLAQGILDLHGIAQDAVRGQPDLVEHRGGHEGVGDDLAVAHGPAKGTGLGLQLHLSGVAPLGRGLELGDGDLVVAVGSSHFLSDIRHADQVRPEGGHQDVVPFHRDLQQVQIVDHILPGNVGAQQAVDLLRLQLYGPGLGHIVDDIDHAVQHIAAGKLLHQLTGPLHSGNRQHGVQMLFELAGGLGTHAQSQSGLADGGAVEVGGLKNHHPGVVPDLRIQAAHDAGKADGLGFIGDDQHAGLQGSLGALQGGHGLALLGLPD